MHLVAAHDLAAAGCAGHGHLHLGAAQQIDHQQGFTFLGALGKKNNSFAHKNQTSLISDEDGASAPHEEKR